jgi:hypothetical protein
MSYSSLEKAMDIVLESRAYQMEQWTGSLEDRPPEEWLLLLNHYLTKTNAVYAETPEINKDGTTNYDGRRRVRKYLAILANLALWGIQSFGEELI